MAKPPISPIKIGAENLNYFDVLVKEVQPYFDDINIKLSFDGYKDTMIRYSELKQEDVNEAWDIAKEFNMWSEYFAELCSLTQKLFLDSETEKIEKIAIISTNRDNKNVSNGERLANKDETVIQVRKKRNCLQSFYNELELKITYLERAYYHCKATVEWNSQSINKKI